MMDATLNQQVNAEVSQAIQQVSRDAIICADSRGYIIYFNPAAERIFTMPAAEAIGHPLTILMPERFHASHENGLRRFLATGEARVIGKTVQLAGKRKDGSEFPLNLSLAAWKAGVGTLFMATLQDLSERSRAEDAFEQSEEWFRLLVSEVIRSGNWASTG